MEARPETQTRTARQRWVRLATPPDLTGFIDVPAEDGPQIFIPALTVDGDLHLQPGESIVTTFDTIGAGIRAGLSPVRQAGGSMEAMRGRCHVTTTRAVFVCHSWDLGGGLDSAGPRGARVLVGQVRWPWLASVSYAHRTDSIDGLIELRCVQAGDHRDTSVFLAMVPAPDVLVDTLVDTIVDAVREDRLGHPGVRPENEVALAALDIPPASSRWSSLQLPGTYKRMTSTAAHGGHSASSLSAWQYRLVERIHV